MKLYNVTFTPVWPVGGCLVIRAKNLQDAEDWAEVVLKHQQFSVEEITLRAEPQTIAYVSGDY